MTDARTSPSPASTPTSASPARPGATRAELIARWSAARRRRDAAELGSAEHRAAVIEVGELEVLIAAADVTAQEGRPAEPAHGAELHHS